MNPKKQSDFILRIPMALYASFKNPSKREVFLAVYSFAANGKGECFASQRAIAERALRGKFTVKRYLSELVEDGYLKVSGKKVVRGGRVTVYIVGHSGAEDSNSGPQWATKSPEVGHTAPRSGPPATTKQLKETHIRNQKTSSKAQELKKAPERVESPPEDLVQAVFAELTKASAEYNAKHPKGGR